MPKTKIDFSHRRVLEPDKRILSGIHESIMVNLSRPMPTIEALAQKACMSESKFRSLFQYFYGTSIYQYHLMARMDLAKNLLVSNEYTITQIAYKVGFSHHQSFIKTFMKHTGLSPRQFQDKMMEHSNLKQSDEDEMEGLAGAKENK
jgi:AraC-like DNA-binding protein